MEFILGPPSEGQAPSAGQQGGSGLQFILDAPERSPPMAPSRLADTAGRPPPMRVPRQQAPVAPEEEKTWSETLGRAKEQLIPSTIKMGQDIFHAVTSPVETGRAIGQLGSGIYSKAEGALGVRQDPQEKAQKESMLDAFVDEYAKKYGSVQGFKKALAEDPAAVLSDASLFITGGTSAAARLTGVAGKTSGMAGAAAKALEKTGQAAQFLDPIYSGARVAALPFAGAAKMMPYAESFLSGSSVESLKDAGKVARYGTPEQREVFRAYQTGAARPIDMVDSFKDALYKAFDEKNQNFFKSHQDTFGTTGVPATNYVSRIDPAINDAFKLAYSVDPISGQTIQIVGGAAKALNDVVNKVNEFKSAAPGSMHSTLEGAHKLKMAIDDIGSAYQKGTPDRKAVDMVRDAVLKTITDDPKIGKQYASTMKAYQEASDKLRAIISEFGVGTGKNQYTALKKILKIKDSETKRSLLAELSKHNANLPYMIAGAELSSLFPHGVRGAILGTTGIGAGIASAAAGFPAAIAGLAAHSPRVLGAVNYAAGRMGAGAARVASPAGRAAIYGATAPQRTTEEQIEEPALRKYLETIGMVESRGNLNAENALSGARGRYQFMPDTWNSIRKQIPGLPADPRQATEQQQFEAAAWLTNQNVEALKKKLGRNPTYSDLGLAHYFGASGATALLGLPPSTRFADLPEDFWQRLGEKFTTSTLLRQNPNLRNQTIGGIKRFYEDKMKSAGIYASGGRVARASGGRIVHEDAAEKLIRAAEIAKNSIGKQTETILEKPDEHVVQALAVANRHI
jgi:hypothetical protein